MNFEQLLAQLRAGGTLTLDQLRFLADELTRRAEAMPGQITAETPQADAERIEREHTEALAEIERIRGQIAELERAAAVVPASTEVRAAIAAERVRIAAIQDDGRHFRRSADFIERHITEGTEVAAFRQAILEDLRTASERNPVFPHAEITRDEGDTQREGMIAAIAVRLARAGGERNIEVPAIARPWAERNLVEIAADFIGYRASGRFLTNRDAEEILRRAFLTTSDFPGIFTNALNVRLLARYEAAVATYRAWAGRYTAPDFRAVNVIRAGDFPTLQRVNEAGEIKSGAFSESKETFQVFAYAVMLNITRQMMVNDQLGAIDQVLGSSGQRVADWENAQMYTLLLSAAGAGPTLLTDNKAVFHTDHANLAAAGSAISVTSVGDGFVSMMKHTTLDGLHANFTPMTLVVGPAYFIAAEQLLTAITPATNANAVPASLRRLTVVTDPNITGNAWYLFADPATAPTFLYGFLEGFEGPRLSSEDVFDVQGMRVKLEHDFGTGAADFRGAYRNPGA